MCKLATINPGVAHNGDLWQYKGQVWGYCLRTRIVYYSHKSLATCASVYSNFNIVYTQLFMKFV